MLLLLLPEQEQASPLLPLLPFPMLHKQDEEKELLLLLLMDHPLEGE